jgi:hypothetical protein
VSAEALGHSYLAKARRQVRGPADVLLLARMTAWCVALRALKHVVPLATLVRMAHPRRTQRTKIAPGTRNHGKGAGQAPGTKDQEPVVVLSRWVARFTRLSARGPCLERSLVAYRYLTLANFEPRLVVGVAPGQANGDPVRGHAWVVVDGVALDETAESLSGFHTVVEFDAGGRRVPA